MCESTRSSEVTNRILINLLFYIIIAGYGKNHFPYAWGSFICWFVCLVYSPKFCPLIVCFLVWGLKFCPDIQFNYLFVCLFIYFIYSCIYLICTCIYYVFIWYLYFIFSNQTVMTFLLLAHIPTCTEESTGRARTFLPRTNCSNWKKSRRTGY